MSQTREQIEKSHLEGIVTKSFADSIYTHHSMTFLTATYSTSVTFNRWIENVENL